MYSIGLSYKCKKLSRYGQGHFFDKVADEIFVINVGGYIGESTRSEIAYAKSQGIAVRYLE